MVRRYTLILGLALLLVALTSGVAAAEGSPEQVSSTTVDPETIQMEVMMQVHEQLHAQLHEQLPPEVHEQVHALIHEHLMGDHMMGDMEVGTS